MFHVHNWKRVHLVGIGGINMSAVAKLLLAAGVRVTGTDVADSEIVRELAQRGVPMLIGPHDERHVPPDCDALIYTSAAPEDNPERVAARNRKIPEVNNFEWLGLWFGDKRVVLVTGTHGKSTTTALLGQMCNVGGLDPTVIVGSKLSAWTEGNLRIGKSDLVIIEGDEYAKHFLAFHPAAIIINNIELDHTDVYADVADVRKTFERLLHQVKLGGTVVANGEQEQVNTAVKPFIATKQLKVTRFGKGDGSKLKVSSSKLDDEVTVGWKDGSLHVKIETGKEVLELFSSLMGAYNGMNIAAAAIMARELKVNDEAIKQTVSDFKGIWRRMELLTTRDGVPVYSDYGHHPTAVRSALDALRESFPDKRIVLCFQPHHKNRTKHLFDDFVTCFDRADILVLCEIYDVAGRNAPEDEDMTSGKLLDAIQLRIKNEELKIQSQYASDPDEAVKVTLSLLKPNDVCVFMGAGDMDAAVRKTLTT